MAAHAHEGRLQTTSVFLTAARLWDHTHHMFHMGSANRFGFPFFRPLRVLARALCPFAVALMAVAQSDDFNDGNDTGWSHYTPLAAFGAGATYSFPAGGYRIAAPASPAPDLLGPQRAGSLRAEAIFTRLQASVDIEGWDNTVNQSLGLIARVGTLGIGTTAGYTYNYNTRSGFHQLTLVLNESPSRQLNESLFKIDPTQKYRLTFTLVGHSILGQMFSATNPAVPLHSVFAVDETHSSGTAGVFVFSLDSATGVDARFDNYSATVPNKVRATLLDASPADGERTVAPIEAVEVRLASLETTLKPESIRLEVDGQNVAFELFDGAPLYLLTHAPSSPLKPDAPHTAKVTFSDEDGPQSFGWRFGAASASTRLFAAALVNGEFAAEPLATLDAIAGKFTLLFSGKQRFFRVGDTVTRRITAAEVVADNVVISFR